MRNETRRWTVGLGLAAATLAIGCQGSESKTNGRDTIAVATGRATAQAVRSTIQHESPDVRSEARQLISQYHAIRLTPEQEAIKRQALSAIPAPCCKDYSIATCCCPCNLAKSVWGLSHQLILEDGQDVEGVRRHVSEWLASTNRSGYAGDACYKGRCGLPFAHDGCGGMNEERIS